jgi:hypothetical protein
MDKYYNRLYLCQAKIGKIECIFFNNIKEVKEYKKRNGLNNVSEDKNINRVFPIHNTLDTVIPICKYTPYFMDLYILRYKLYKILRVQIKKK